MITILTATAQLTQLVHTPILPMNIGETFVFEGKEYKIKAIKHEYCDTAGGSGFRQIYIHHKVLVE